VVNALRRMLAMRIHMRARTVEGRFDDAVLDAVGLSRAQVDDMYRTLAIANYEDRYVIPSTHREYAENAFDLKSACGFSFGQGCYDGRTVGNLFSALGPSAGRMAPPPVEEALEREERR
jgi:nitrate reductase beta subunit